MIPVKWKTCIGVCVVVATLLTMSVFHFMLLFWAFFAGVALCYLILRPGYEVPNLFLSFTKPQKSVYNSSPKQNKCSVCGKYNCKQQRPEEAYHIQQPWVDIMVNEKVDKAISEFLDTLISRYVQNWYKDLSEDETFIHELKHCLRHCLAILYRRVNNINLEEMIIKKLVKVAIFHLNICLSAQKAGAKNEDDVLLFYGPKLHVALKSRRSELNYIRAICDHIYPFIFPKYLIKSKIAKSLLREILSSNVLMHGIDAIEDPDKINNLLLIFFDKSSPREADAPPSTMVPFLAEFASNDVDLSTSLLHIDLPKIINTQDMLYQFMSFLKTINAVHYLQFCLTVDDFNRRCLAPEQNEEQMKRLHEEARTIYRTYCRTDSTSFIHFQPSVIDELKEIAEGRWENVSRLRTSAPLFQAYDHAYNLLEHLYCPMFYQSGIYYQMVCGKRAPSKQAKIGARQGTGRFPDGSGGSTKHLGRKIKEAFKTNASEGGIPEGLGTDVESSLQQDEDEKSSQLLLEDEVVEDIRVMRDLSAWRIEIPEIKIMKREDEKGMDKCLVFCVHVKRVNISNDDEEPVQWHVLRRYKEFYVLESKLTEFHGSLTPAILPPKKILSPNFEFLDEKRPEFERFLKTLITKQSLRSSELLYDFLLPSRAEAVARFDGKMLPEVKLGRFFRRVPTKLVKEKGQHLEVFLRSFIQSCESPKPKPGNYESTTDNPEVLMDQKLHNELYPESGWQADSYHTAGATKDKDGSYLSGVCDYLIYMATQVFEADNWVHQSMIGLKLLFNNTIEPFAHNYLKQKIDCYRQEHHVVDLVHLFRDIIFFNNNPPRTAKEKEQRRKLTLQCWREFVPVHFVKLIGETKHIRGCNKVFELLQQPKLNKQLGYMLLDVVLIELFPELNAKPEDSQSSSL